MGDNDLLNRKSAVAYLNRIGCAISDSTLERLARKREGPPFTKILQRIVRYRRADLDVWATRNTTRIE
jgi:predicted DNA-binding transcriptional regulator AlpA